MYRKLCHIIVISRVISCFWKNVRLDPGILVDALYNHRKEIRNIFTQNVLMALKVTSIPELAMHYSVVLN